MSTTAKIILDKRRSTKKGYPIKILVRNNGMKHIPLKEYTDLEHWQNEKLLRSHPDYKRLHEVLLKREVKLLNEVKYCNDHGFGLGDSVRLITNGLEDRESRIIQLKNELRSLQGDSRTMLFEFWDIYMRERESVKKSIRAFEETKTQLLNFTLESDMAINDITYEFLNEFSTYKLQNGCGSGGLSFYLRTFRTVYLAAQKRESLGIKSINPFRGLIEEGVSKDPVEMSKDEFIKWKSFTPHKFSTKKSQDIVLRRRDLWLFQFYIGGHDFVDIAKLEWKKNIRNGRIRFKRYKNRRHPGGGPTVDNKLLPEAMTIIKKYGTPDRERVFSFIPDPRDKESYNYYINNTRRALRKISQQIELTDIMKTKSTRYIFKTWADQMQLHEPSIKQIMGHADQKVSSRYGARLPNTIVDPILKKVIIG
nr:phage integrase SAM-like domain-containing protein [uncultured Allomuricauda sp.]